MAVLAFTSYSVSCDPTWTGKSLEFLIKNRLESDTMRGAEGGLVVTVSSNERLIKWIDAVGASVLRSLELRVLLGKAVHFVADSACALGRVKGRMCFLFS